MPKEENAWTTAFKELYRSTKDRNISGEKKSQLFSQLGRLKKEMTKPLKGAPGELPGEDSNPNIIEIDPKISFYFTNSWAMKHREGDYAHAHAHSNSVISGVFYVEVPKNSGNLIFHKNSYNSSNAMISSLALPYKKYNQYNSEEWSIKTEDNLLVLFPSNLTHSVPVSFNKKDRYCIAFNCFIKGTLTTNGVDQLAFG
jgi:uncharacterized protein (TIGR02466 family)